MDFDVYVLHFLMIFVFLSKVVSKELSNLQKIA